MSLSDEVRRLEDDLAAERKRRVAAEHTLDEVRRVLRQYSESSVKPWGRTLQMLGKLVGVEVPR